MFFLLLPLTILLISIPIIIVSVIITNKNQNRTYEVIDTYLVSKGTLIYYKKYRHITVYFSRLRNEKAVNLYLSEDDRYLETVSRSLIDKELTELDKDVFVLRMEDTEQNHCMISYDVSMLDNSFVEFLFDLNIGEKVQLKDVTKGKSQNFPSFSKILMNEHRLI